ncbi:MAG: MaoC family dehydratase N-terminal domain-containing protein [Bacteriovoracia bacterium]
MHQPFPEHRVKFEYSFSKEQAEKFFSSVNWQIQNRPATPPTMVTVFRLGEFMVFEKLGYSLSQLLHGEQKYTFHEELRAGEKYSGETYIKSRFEKSGTSGRHMIFYVLLTDLFDSNGHLSAQAQSTIIARVGND